jgi:hypothetical protein
VACVMRLVGVAGGRQTLWLAAAGMGEAQRVSLRWRRCRMVRVTPCRDPCNARAAAAAHGRVTVGRQQRHAQRCCGGSAVRTGMPLSTQHVRKVRCLFAPLTARTLFVRAAAEGLRDQHQARARGEFKDAAASRAGVVARRARGPRAAGRRQRPPRAARRPVRSGCVRRVQPSCRLKPPATLVPRDARHTHRESLAAGAGASCEGCAGATAVTGAVGAGAPARAAHHSC